jgi:dTDP-4-amino-4,6-dideoxygalactose transaminase
MTSSLPADPRAAWPPGDDDIRQALLEMFADGSWGRYLGRHGEALQSALASRFRVPHVHLCCSGTAAIEIALAAAPVMAADEVILCAYDFKANFINVLSRGATPVLVDCLAGAPAPDLDEILNAITPRTRAIIVSHLHGCLVDIPGLREQISGRGICLIEDACQNPGASIAGHPVGSLGDIGVLSFGGSKLLTAGRGGAVLTKDPAIARRIHLHVQRGNDAFPLSELQAAVLRPQLQRLDDRNAQRNDFARQLVESLATDRPRQVALRPAIDRGTLEHDSTSIPAFYKLGFEVTGDLNPGTRQRVIASAHSAGLALDEAFPALHRIHARSRFRAAGALPNASRFHDSLLVLHHTHLWPGSMPVPELAVRIQALGHE